MYVSWSHSLWHKLFHGCVLFATSFVFLYIRKCTYLGGILFSDHAVMSKFLTAWIGLLGLHLLYKILSDSMASLLTALFSHLNFNSWYEAGTGTQVPVLGLHTRPEAQTAWAEIDTPLQLSARPSNRTSRCIPTTGCPLPALAASSSSPNTGTAGKAHTDILWQEFLNKRRKSPRVRPLPHRVRKSATLLGMPQPRVRTPR